MPESSLPRVPELLSAIVDESRLLSREDWCLSVPCSKGALSQWIAGKSTPRRHNLMRILTIGREIGVNSDVLMHLSAIIAEMRLTGPTISPGAFAALRPIARGKRAQSPVDPHRFSMSTSESSKNKMLKVLGLLWRAAAISSNGLEEFVRDAREVLGKADFRNKTHILVLGQIKERPRGVSLDLLKQALIAIAAMGPECRVEGFGDDPRDIRRIDIDPRQDAEELAAKFEEAAVRYRNVQFVPLAHSRQTQN